MEHEAARRLPFCCLMQRMPHCSSCHTGKQDLSRARFKAATCVWNWFLISSMGKAAMHVTVFLIVPHDIQLLPRALIMCLWSVFNLVIQMFTSITALFSASRETPVCCIDPYKCVSSACVRLESVLCDPRLRGNVTGPLCQCNAVTQASVGSPFLRSLRTH